MSDNPFSRGRYEYTPTHLYYLPEVLIKTLEDSKPSYIIGSRGSGKTTLLKSLHWKERITNKWLKDQLNGDYFRGKFVATYTKLPLVQINAFQYWLSESPETQHDSLFGLYFDLICAESLALALCELSYSEHFRVEIEPERKAIESYFEKCPFVSDSRQAMRGKSIADCHKLLRSLRNELEKSAISGRDVSETITAFPVTGNGEITKSLADCLLPLLEDGVREWHVKCCFDEAECLDRRQLIVANTIMRTCEWPVSYVLSFVGQPADLSLTTFEALTTQQADLSVAHLDTLESRAFRKLCDGVASIRVKAALQNCGEQSKGKFSTEEILGKLNMNSLVSASLSASEGDFGQELKEMVDAFETENWDPSYSDGDYPPYIESFLANRLNLAPSLSIPKSKRRQASREFRKKFVASYLAICRELRCQSVPYAFANMVIGISDNCVRDYLAQMYYVYEEAGLSLTDFLKGGISWEIQNKAIHKASQEKKESIRTGEDLSNPERVRRLTIALGELTAILQKGSKNDAKSLRSSERGIFKLDRNISPDGEGAELHKIIKDATDAGFLRLTQEGRDILSFKVHASMAPSFGFSYRGSYYEVRLKFTELTQILETASNEELKLLSKEIAKRINSTKYDPRQPDLFELEEDY